MGSISRRTLYILILLCQIFCIQCSNNLINSDQVSEKTNKFILADRNTLLMRGHSTSFTDGYMDGCQSGQYTAGDSKSIYKKNLELAKLNSDYLLGWEQGNSFCYEHMRNLIKHSGSDNPAIYHSKEAIELEKQRIWSELKK